MIRTLLKSQSADDFGYFLRVTNAYTAQATVGIVVFRINLSAPCYVVR